MLHALPSWPASFKLFLMRMFEMMFAMIMMMMFTMIMTIIAMVIMPNLSSISDVVESGTGGMV